MLRQPAPEGDFELQLQLSIGSKREELYKIALEDLYGTICQRYVDYAHFSKYLEILQPVVRDNMAIKALESCYNSTLKAKLLHNLRQRIDAERVTAGLSGSATIRCPYCQIHVARRWDHFLPSKEFPDFFCFPPNLVYVCEICNSDIKKSDLVSHPRETLCPHYDDIHAQQYLFCSVVISDKIMVSFHTLSQSANAYVGGVASRHFIAYELNSKFIAESGSKLSDLVREYIFTCSIAGRDLKRLELDELISGHIVQAERSGRGINYWESVLWKALRDCPNLLDFLKLQRNGAIGSKIT